MTTQNPLHFVSSGTSVQPVDHNPSDFLTKLPVGVYEIQLSSGMNKYFYLEKYFKEFKVPSKLYGNVPEDAELILSRYVSRPESMGALLLGAKGSGKSLIASILINKFIQELQKPVILVNNSWYEHINSLVIFMSKFEDCLFVFDEFDKHYDEADQNCLLNFFDDKSKSHRLSLVIANDAGEITKYYINRPSRFFYNFVYEGIDKETLVEYLEDAGLQDLITPLEYMRIFSKQLTFDVLQCIVDEVKLRGSKDLAKILKRFNFNSSGFVSEDQLQVVSCKVIKDGPGEFPEVDLTSVELDGYRLTFYKDSVELVDAWLYPSNLIDYDHKLDKYTYCVRRYSTYAPDYGSTYEHEFDTPVEILIEVVPLGSSLRLGDFVGAY